MNYDSKEKRLAVAIKDSGGKILRSRKKTF